MALGIALLEKIGLISGDHGADSFDLRLARINRREERARSLAVLFRNQPERSAA